MTQVPALFLWHEFLPFYIYLVTRVLALTWSPTFTWWPGFRHCPRTPIYPGEPDSCSALAPYIYLVTRVLALPIGGSPYIYLVTRVPALPWSPSLICTTISLPGFPSTRNLATGKFYTFKNCHRLPNCMNEKITFKNFAYLSCLSLLQLIVKLTWYLNCILLLVVVFSRIDKET